MFIKDSGQKKSIASKQRLSIDQVKKSVYLSAFLLWLSFAHRPLMGQA